MISATESFIGILDKWVSSCKSGDYRAAVGIAEDLHLHGDLMAIHPDFQRSMARRTPADPRESFKLVSHVLATVTEYHESAAKLPNSAT
jgi:hypothetical protein